MNVVVTSSSDVNVDTKSQLKITLQFPNQAPVSFALDRCLLAEAASPPASGSITLAWSKPVSFASDVLDKLCVFLRAVAGSKQIKQQQHLQRPFPRSAFSSCSLAECIGEAAWVALTQIFDGSPHQYEDATMKRGVFALGIAKTLQLKQELVVDPLTWELARRVRACADATEVRAEFFGGHPGAAAPLNFSEAEISAVKSAVPQIFETQAARMAAASSVKSSGNAVDDDDDDENGDENPDG